MEMPKVSMANFEGPFDLLLHLIKKNEMDIYNIQIQELTNQYLKILEEMKEMDLEITSEFIVIAATLIEIKSKKLLPKAKVEEESEEDIERNLIEKILEYKKFKAVSSFFKDKYISTGDVYEKKPETIEEDKSLVNNDDIFKNTTLIDIYNLYNALLENYSNKQNKENVIQRKIYVDKYKVEDKMQDVLDMFKNEKVIAFNDMIMQCECKMETVVTFLALLELIKLKMIKVFQDNSFDDILIKRRKEDE